jgi:hypothetical protein
MLTFKNDNNQDNIVLSYETGLNKKDSTYFVSFKVLKIDGMFNGEYFYSTKDEIGQKCCMFRLDLEDTEWMDIDLYKSSRHVEEIYKYIGFFVDTVNLTSQKYNKYYSKQ